MSSGHFTPDLPTVKNMPETERKKQLSLSKYHTDVNPEKIDLLKEFCAGKTVLDIGCGNGLYSKFLEEKGYKVLLADVADRRDQRAKNLPFRLMDAEKPDSMDGGFDNIIAFDIVEHLDDDGAFIERCYGMLNAGGRMFVSVPNEDNSVLDKVHLAHVHFTDKTHKREYSEEQLRRLMEGRGFKTLSMKGHVNKLAVYLPGLLSGDGFLSRVAIRFIILQLKILNKSGLIKDKIIADWFGVFEK